MFRFTLKPVEVVEPWGTPPNLRLHWFGLTDGSYYIDLGDVRLLEYVTGDGDDKYVTYQVERLHDDLMDMLPTVLEPIPDDVVALFPDGSLASAAKIVALDAERAGWPDSFDSELCALGRRRLDSMHLSPSASIWFWRRGDRIVVEWDHRDRLIDGRPAWTATIGRREMPLAKFVAEVTSFHDRFTGAMAERVAEVSRGWDRPDVAIDLQELARNQRRAEAELEVALRRRDPITAWPNLRVLLANSPGRSPGPPP